MPEKVEIIHGEHASVMLAELPARSTGTGGSRQIQLPGVIGSPSLGRSTIQPWGPHDNFPAHAKKLICSDENAMGIIDKKVNLHIGQGITYYRQLRSGDKLELQYFNDPAIDRFLDEREDELLQLLRRADTNKEYYGMFTVEFILGQYRDRVASFRVIDGDWIRPMEIPAGSTCVQSFAIKSQLSPGTHPAQQRIPIIPAWQDEWKQNTNSIPFKFIVSGGDYLPGNPYFGVPRWYGSAKQLEYSCLIMEMLLAGAKNGWNIRYLLEVDEKFYADCNDANEKAKKKSKLVADLNRLLSGAENSGKVLVSDMFTNHIAGKQYSGVKITEINKSTVDANVTKLLELQGKSKSTALGLDPALAGIDTDKNMASGSDIRNKYLLYLAMCAPNPRRELLKILKVIQCIHGWDPSIRFGFRDIEMVTLDTDPRGYQNKDA